MCDPDPVFYLPSPAAAVRSLASVVGAVNPRALAGIVAGGALVAFVAAHAVIVGTALAVFLAAMGWIVWAMRAAVLRQARARAATMATVTVRRGQGVRAVTAGQRALPAPQAAITGQVLTPAERVAR